MGKPTICIGKNKDADQLRGNCEADQHLCFRYSDSTIPLLLKSEISSFLLSSVMVQVGLCRTWSETTLLVFPRGGSNVTATYQCLYALAPRRIISVFIFKISHKCPSFKFRSTVLLESRPTHVYTFNKSCRRTA